VFGVDDVAVVVVDGSPDLVLEGARACPAAAILRYDAENGEQVDPNSQGFSGVRSRGSHGWPHDRFTRRSGHDR
jgi:hypothetical protein